MTAIEVSLTHGRTMEIGNAAVAGVRPAPRLIEGSLQPADMQVVEAWSRLNEAAFRIDTACIGSPIATDSAITRAVHPSKCGVPQICTRSRPDLRGPACV